MSVFADLSDEDLATEIAALSAQIRGAPANPTIRSIAGEGRKVEYGNASSSDLRRLYREAREEQERRAGGMGGSAIPVRF